MSVTYTEIVQTGWEDGSGNPVSGTVTFKPNQGAYDASGVPVVDPSPVVVTVTAGTLGYVELVNTDSQLAYETLTGFLFYSVLIEVGTGPGESWDFFLPSSLGASVNLFALANTGAGGGGGMDNPMTALGDLIDGGTDGTPERLAGNTSATPELLTSTGTGSAAQAPAWQSIAALGIAPLASPALSGEPTGPTASPLTDSTQLATTAYADAAVAVEKTRAEAAEALLAPLASPDLTGTPTAPTASGGTDTTQVATTAFVQTAAAAAQSAAEDASVAIDGDTMAGYLVPAVTALTDGASVALNAALGNDFTWSLGGASHTLQAPSNPRAGQKITIEIDYGGSFTPEFATGAGGFDFGTAGQPSWTATSGKSDLAAFRYSAVSGTWAFLGAGLGYSS